MMSEAICEICGCGSRDMADSVLHSFMYTDPNPDDSKLILVKKQPRNL